MVEAEKSIMLYYFVYGRSAFPYFSDEVVTSFSNSFWLKGVDE